MTVKFFSKQLVLLLILSWFLLCFHYPVEGMEPTLRNLIEASLLTERKQRGVEETIHDPENDPLTLPSDYNPLQLPPVSSKGEPVQVHVSLLLINIRNIDEINELVTIEFKMKIYWNDTRLSMWNSSNPRPTWRSKQLSLSDLDKIWSPDIFMERVKSVDMPTILSQPASLRLSVNGSLRHSSRMTVTMACRMYFQLYPADRQNCTVDLQSYVYYETEMELKWAYRENKTVGVFTNSGDGIHVLSQESNSNFDIYIHPESNVSVARHTTLYDIGKTAPQFHSGLRFSLILKRGFGYHLLQTYVPSALCVVVSWLSFLLPLSAVAEKMAYCLTCLFTLTTMFYSVKQNTPPVNYIKALDVWMTACIFFLFLALTKHAIVSKVKRRKAPPQERRRKFKGKVTSSPKKVVDENETSFSHDIITVNDSTVKQSSHPRGDGDAKKKLSQSWHLSGQAIYHQIAKSVNSYMSLAIPVLFVLFNLIYWSVILFAKYAKS